MHWSLFVVVVIVFACSFLLKSLFSNCVYTPIKVIDIVILNIAYTIVTLLDNQKTRESI